MSFYLGTTNFDDRQLGYLIPVSALCFFGLVEIAIQWLIVSFHFVGIIKDKNEDYSKRLNAVLMLILGTCCRLVVLVPCLILLYPNLLRKAILGDESRAYEIISLVIFAINVAFSVLPFMFGVKMLLNSHKRKKKKDSSLDIPQVYIIIPIYNEIPEILEKNIRAILQLHYPKHKINLILAFDDEKISKSLICAYRLFGIYSSPSSISYPRTTNADYNGMKVSICRFDHGGKRKTQEKAYKHIMSNCYGGERNALLLFIDSDIVLEVDSLINIVHDMQETRKKAVTGFILINEPDCLIEKLQDQEYLQGQLVHRYFESVLGGLLCLPGALTAIDLQVFSSLSQAYFEETNPTCDTIRKYHQRHLGEDRFLTLLLLEMVNAKNVGFSHVSRGETDPPKSFRTLVIQRRRWLLGTLANDAHMLSSVKLWKKLSLLMLFTLLDSNRGLGFILLAMYFAIPLLFAPLWLILIVVFAPIILLWILVAFANIQLSRARMIWLFLITHVFIMVLSFTTSIFSILTLRRLTWGGPRTKENIALNTVEIQETKMEKDEFDGRERQETSDILLSVYQSYYSD